MVQLKSCVNYMASFDALPLLKNIHNTAVSIFSVGCSPYFQHATYVKHARCKYTVMDSSEEDIAAARKVFSDVNFIVGDFMKVPNSVIGSNYDVVVAMRGLSYYPVDKHKDIIAKMGDLLNPNGIMLISSSLSDIQRYISTGAELGYLSLPSKDLGENTVLVSFAKIQ